jgi:hypothetical protein
MFLVSIANIYCLNLLYYNKEYQKPFPDIIQQVKEIQEDFHFQKISTFGVGTGSKMM